MQDEIDLKILTLLFKNGRMTWSELAGYLALSSPSTAERVHRLEEKGIIKGYHAAINLRLLGYHLLSFVAVCLTHPKYRQSFVTSINQYAEVEECHHIAGEDDYLLKVRCFNTEHLDDFLNNRLKQIPGISRTRTTVALSTVKEMSNEILSKGMVESD
jgi:Lrp/AsnC family leucine-responsive transcriptional regulator